MRIEDFIAARLDEVEHQVTQQFLSGLTTDDDRDRYRKVLHWPASDWSDHPDYQPEWAKGHTCPDQD